MRLHFAKAQAEGPKVSGVWGDAIRLWAADWLALHAEVERLRAALAQIAVGKLAQDMDDGTLMAVRLCGIARAALRPEER